MIWYRNYHHYSIIIRLYCQLNLDFPRECGGKSFPICPPIAGIMRRRAPTTNTSRERHGQTQRPAPAPPAGARRATTGAARPRSPRGMEEPRPTQRDGPTGKAGGHRNAHTTADRNAERAERRKGGTAAATRATPLAGARRASKAGGPPKPGRRARRRPDPARGRSRRTRGAASRGGDAGGKRAQTATTARLARADQRREPGRRAARKGTPQRRARKPKRPTRPGNGTQGNGPDGWPHNGGHEHHQTNGHHQTGRRNGATWRARSILMTIARLARTPGHCTGGPQKKYPLESGLLAEVYHHGWAGQ